MNGGVKAAHGVDRTIPCAKMHRGNPCPIVAIELLEDALRVAEMDHFSNRNDIDCTGCLKANQIKRELAALTGE